MVGATMNEWILTERWWSRFDTVQLKHAMIIICDRNDDE